MLTDVKLSDVNECRRMLNISKRIQNIAVFFDHHLATCELQKIPCNCIVTSLRTIYEKLASAFTEELAVLYHQRVEEISPNIRYCAYNIGR